MTAWFVAGLLALAAYVGFAVGVLLCGVLWRRRERLDERHRVEAAYASAAVQVFGEDWDFGRKPAGTTRADMERDTVMPYHTTTIFEDVEAAVAELARPQPVGPGATIHHPECPALASGSLRDCACGGWAFPTRAPADDEVAS